MHLFTHFAYLDPSTGSLLIQSLIGVGAGVIVFGHRAIASVAKKTKDIFTREKQETNE